MDFKELISGQNFRIEPDMTGLLSSMKVNSKAFINSLLGPAWFYKRYVYYHTPDKV